MICASANHRYRSSRGAAAMARRSRCWKSAVLQRSRCTNDRFGIAEDLRAELVAELHCVADFGHRLLRDGTAAARSFHDDLVHALRLRGELISPLANRREEFFQGIEEFLLHLDVADRSLTIAILQILD